MGKRVFYFKLLLLASLFTSCKAPLTQDNENGLLRFGVCDVGQGLSQIAVKDGHAIIFDMGPPPGYTNWLSTYNQFGRPAISAIAISHTDLDHRGGLTLLDSSVQWDGTLVVSPVEDTTLLRDSSGFWKNRIKFKIVAGGDTLGGLENVSIRCLWPLPDQIDNALAGDDQRNRYSSVYSIVDGATSVLITSDIDTVSEQGLLIQYGETLRSDLLVVPHHGSSSSADQVFFGTVDPDIGLLSYGLYNDYGHPSKAVLLLLLRMGTVVRSTALEGSVEYESNGFYWIAF
jgi:competence protein ComEC